LEKALEGKGYKNPKNIKVDFDDSKKIINNLLELPLINVFWERVGEPTIRGDSSINTDGKTMGLTTATHDVNGNITNKPFVRLSPLAFKSLFSVAATIMHEFQHVRDFNSGYYTSLLKSIKIIR